MSGPQLGSVDLSPSGTAARGVRWAALFVALLGVLAALPTGDGSRSGLLGRSADATTTTTTTTAPSIFGPVPDPAGVTAVRTSTGLVLPVLGGTDGAWQVLTPCAFETVAGPDATPVAGAHVVLDAGHGGSEPGAVGPAGLTEASANLDIALRTKALLEARGAVVELTRPGDVRYTIQTRAAIAVALQPRAFVSIHHNAAPTGVQDRAGTEIYHQSASPESQRLGGLVWEEMQTRLSPFLTEWAVSPNYGVLARRPTNSDEDFLGVLRRSAGVPTVLTEAFFLSDPDEEALLLREDVRQSEAEAIAAAVERFVTTADPGSGFRDPLISDASTGGGGGQSGCRDPAIG